MHSRQIQVLVLVTGVNRNRCHRSPPLEHRLEWVEDLTRDLWFVVDLWMLSWFITRRTNGLLEDISNQLGLQYNLAKTAFSHLEKHRTVNSHDVSPRASFLCRTDQRGADKFSLSIVHSKTKKPHLVGVWLNYCIIIGFLCFFFSTDIGISSSKQDFKGRLSTSSMGRSRAFFRASRTWDFDPSFTIKRGGFHGIVHMILLWKMVNFRRFNMI